MSRQAKFSVYAWGVLIFNLGVILWGAYVRATGSGAGCGSHWPLCNGMVIPRAPQLETIIEFTHRATSGLAFLLVVGMFIWGFRLFPKKHVVRLGATLSLIFIITEALVGAGLVLFEWVAHDASLGRVISMSVHLVNTFLLLASLTLTAWWSKNNDTVRLRDQGILLWVFGIALAGVLVLGVSGAITALGDTLFPVNSLAEGIEQDFNPAAHIAIRLRVWHPILAIVVGSYLIIIGGLILLYARDEVRSTLKSKMDGVGHDELQYKIKKYSNVSRFSSLLITIVIIQLLAGLINLILLAPVWMQLIHLLLADLLWIGLVLLVNSMFSVPVVYSEGELTLSAPDSLKHPTPGLSSTFTKYRNTGN